MSLPCCGGAAEGGGWVWPAFLTRVLAAPALLSFLRSFFHSETIRRIIIYVNSSSKGDEGPRFRAVESHRAIPKGLKA